MTIRTIVAALKFVGQHGVVLEAANGPAPSLASEIAGEKLHGSWWAHPKSHLIYAFLEGVRDSPDVLACRLIGGKVTLVHRRMWPALVRCAENFDRGRLASIREEHTKTGAHRVVETAFPDWVPADVMKAARALSEKEALAQISAVLSLCAGSKSAEKSQRQRGL